jgi:hypothetical protein
LQAKTSPLRPDGHLPPILGGGLAGEGRRTYPLPPGEGRVREEDKNEYKDKNRSAHQRAGS